MYGLDTQNIYYTYLTAEPTCWFCSTGNQGEKQAAIYFNERAVRNLASGTSSDLDLPWSSWIDPVLAGWSSFHFHKATYGGFHKWGYPFIAGWFSSWKIPI